MLKFTNILIQISTERNTDLLVFDIGDLIITNSINTLRFIIYTSINGITPESFLIHSCPGL